MSTYPNFHPSRPLIVALMGAAAGFLVVTSTDLPVWMGAVVCALLAVPAVAMLMWRYW
jgi:hypothetical protein